MFYVRMPRVAYEKNAEVFNKTDYLDPKRVKEGEEKKTEEKQKSQEKKEGKDTEGYTPEKDFQETKKALATVLDVKEKRTGAQESIKTLEKEIQEERKDNLDTRGERKESMNTNSVQ